MSSGADKQSGNEYSTKKITQKKASHQKDSGFSTEQNPTLSKPMHPSNATKGQTPPQIFSQQL